MTGVTLMRLVSHIGDAICDWSQKYVTGDTTCVWRRNCATAPVTSSLGDMLIRIAHIADHLVQFPLSLSCTTSLSYMQHCFIFTQQDKISTSDTPSLLPRYIK